MIFDVLLLVILAALLIESACWWRALAKLRKKLCSCGCRNPRGRCDCCAAAERHGF